MTKEEAIYLLRNTAWLAPSLEPVEEALDMAIEALQRTSNADQRIQHVESVDLISRQSAIDLVENVETARLKGEIDLVYAPLINGLKALPSAQPETAKCIVGKSRDGMTLWYQCDMCNEPVDVQDNYCRGCGRRLIDERLNQQTGGD